MSRNEVLNECTPAPGVADGLRAKRTEILREANRRIKRIDRSLALVVSTDAEAVLVEAKEVLETA
jgi:hypothetical protein